MAPRVFWIDAPSKGRLAIVTRPLGGEYLNTEIAALKGERITDVLSLLEPAEAAELQLREEKSVCAAYAIAFHSYPIPDRGLPENLSTFDTLIGDLAGAMRGGASVAVHCRAGIGRSSLAAASIMVRSGLAPTDALARISTARGIAAPDTDAQRAWILGLERADE